MPSLELRLHGYYPAGRRSNSRLRRPDPASVYPLAGPVSADTSNPTIPAQPSPRACTHVVSARKWTYTAGRLTIPTSPPAPRAAVGIPQNVSCASNEAPVATSRSHCGTLPPEARDSSCARAAERARRAHPGSLRQSRSRRWPACSGVLPGCRAQHVPPRQPATWRPIHPPTPAGRYSSPAPPRLATDARRGTGTLPLRTDCRGAGRPRRPNRPPRPRVAVQAMADGSPGGGRARLVGTLQVGSDIYMYFYIYLQRAAPC